MLYIISTPIGNLKDISHRAVETLQSVDLIAAEDTRQTKKLCRSWQIDTPLTSYHEHNAVQKIPDLLKKLENGMALALVSDAGTPGISDPGYRLIREAAKAKIPVTVIPGPTALIAALTLSGLPSDRFVFEGFLPPKTAGRRKCLERFRGEERTVIFYESVHRISKSLEDIAEILGNPVVVCVREITKTFEEVREGAAGTLAEEYAKKPPKGEFVVLINLSEKCQRALKEKALPEFG